MSDCDHHSVEVVGSDPVSGDCNRWKCLRCGKVLDEDGEVV